MAYGFHYFGRTGAPWSAALGRLRTLGLSRRAIVVEALYKRLILALSTQLPAHEFLTILQDDEDIVSSGALDLTLRLSQWPESN
jgi:hypothetical protein